MITIVLPIKVEKKVNEINDLDRAVQFLIPSIEKFFCLDKLYEFIIISPECELNEVKSKIKSDKIKFTFYNDHQVSPVLPEYGWFKQQVIKLAIFDKVKTDHYMLFDADMFLTRKVNYEPDLFIDGKPLCNASQYKTHHSWWIETTKLFKMYRYYDPEAIGPDLTPMIMNCSIVRQALGKLTSIYEKDWTLVLYDTAGFVNADNDIAPVWHEYGIYFVYLMTWHDIFDYYHGYSYFVGNSVWNGESEVTNEFIDSMFGSENSFVSVIQSNIKNLNLEEIYEKLKKHLIL